MLTYPGCPPTRLLVRVYADVWLVRLSSLGHQFSGFLCGSSYATREVCDLEARANSPWRSDNECRSGDKNVID